MPKLSIAVPKYRKHRASGKAVVTINGRDHYTTRGGQCHIGGVMRE